MYVCTFYSVETRSNIGTGFVIPTNASIIEFLKKTAEPITNKFMLAPPSASSINIRRNSTQQATTAGNVTNAPASKSSASTLNGITCEATPASTFTDPPPIPKRTFLGKIMPATRSLAESTSASSPTLTIKTTINNVKQTLDEVKRRNGNPKQMISQNQTVQRRLVENHYPIDQYSDDDRLSIESSVFEEPRSSDPIISFAASNRSSSDSNKSQTTIDTGYMSASNDDNRIFFGASEDFRSRFSSVDTQSSIDSCTSSDLQTHQAFTLQNPMRCIISPLAIKRDDSDDKSIGRSFNRLNSSNSLLAVSNKSLNTINKNVKNQSDLASSRTRNQALGVRSQSMQKPSTPSNVGNTDSSQRVRPSPPAPVHSQNSLDSGRILYNGSMLGAFQSGLAKITSAAATTSEVVMGRRSFKRNFNQKNSQIAHSKLNQRQDSSISNDSFSLNSSPSYTPKNLDAPLLGNAAKKNQTSFLNGQVENSSNVLTNRYPFPGRSTQRQDSTLSNDSFSQTSSPGYNTKLLEQPLLAHSVKLHASKFFEILIGRRLCRWCERLYQHL